MGEKEEAAAVAVAARREEDSWRDVAVVLVLGEGGEGMG